MKKSEIVRTLICGVFDEELPEPLNLSECLNLLKELEEAERRGGEIEFIKEAAKAPTRQELLRNWTSMTIAVPQTKAAEIVLCIEDAELGEIKTTFGKIWWRYAE